jgi:hypothetical protein
MMISMFNVLQVAFMGVDIPAFHGGGRPQVPLRAIFLKFMILDFPSQIFDVRM